MSQGQGSRLWLSCVLWTVSQDMQVTKERSTTCRENWSMGPQRPLGTGFIARTYVLISTEMLRPLFTSLRCIYTFWLIYVLRASNSFCAQHICIGGTILLGLSKLNRKVDDGHHVYNRMRVDCKYLQAKIYHHGHILSLTDRPAHDPRLLFSGGDAEERSKTTELILHHS